MFGRVVKFLLLCSVLLGVYHALFSPTRRRSVRAWIVVLAQALLMSSMLWWLGFWLTR